MRFNQVSAFGSFFLLAVLGLAVQPVSGTTVNGKIAFVSDRDGNWEIYSMNPDGTAQTRLTTNPADDFAPMWSPDGGKIAFVSTRDGTYQIYVMNADGTATARLTKDSGNDVDPTWSPDGKRIAFASDRDTDNFQIYAMNADGSNVQRLTNDNGNDEIPEWSPDGTKIAYDDSIGIYVMGADGSNVTAIARTQDSQESWSPDGSKFVFTSLRDGNYEIYTMNADGSNQVRLTSNTFSDLTPAWSPDGHKIVFGSNRNGYDQVFVMGTDGTNPVPLTINKLGDGAPTWQAVHGTPCPLTAEFWKKNPTAWPVKSLLIGGKKYTQAQLLALMSRPAGNDESLSLADQLVAAKLNVASGTLSTPVHATIVAADRALHPFSGFLPYHVARTSVTGRAMAPLAATLIKYNARTLTPSCIR